VFQYIIGKVDEIGEDYIVLDNNDIGYHISTSKTSIADIGNNYEKRKIFTFLSVREDGISMYGFTTKEELNMFRLLLLVTKIGPKVAVGVLSTMTPYQIKLAILNDDIEALSKAPGIGKKTGSRIILELKDKIDGIIGTKDTLVINNIDTSTDEAIVALTTLGYTRNEANRALARIDTKDLNTEDIIKIALKELLK